MRPRGLICKAYYEARRQRALGLRLYIRTRLPYLFNEDPIHGPPKPQGSIWKALNREVPQGSWVGFTGMLLFSFTRLMADRFKERLAASALMRIGGHGVIANSEIMDKRRRKAERKARAFSLRVSNCVYRSLSTSFLIIAWMSGDVYTFPRAFEGGTSTVAIVFITCYAISRAHEVVYSFGRDALRIARGEPGSSDLTREDRIKLALWSYYSLLIDFALLFWIWQHDFIGDDGLLPFKTVLDAVYYSAVTITTLGYGDISPSQTWGRIMVMYELVCGIALFILSIAIYVGASRDDAPKVRRYRIRPRHP